MTRPIPVATARAIEASTQDHDALEQWVRTRNIRRDFWLSLGLFVAAEGLVGFLAILFSGFPFDVEFSRTLLSAILCVATALAGFALIRRRWLNRYSRVAVVEAALAFPLLVTFIWIPGGGAWSNLHWSAVVLLAGFLATSVQRLWLGDWKGASLKKGVFIVTSSSIAVVVPLTIAAIWGSSSVGSDRALGAFSFLTFVGFLLTPILRRALRKRGSAAPANPSSR
jgi:hypothetical protein